MTDENKSNQVRKWGVRAGVVGVAASALTTFALMRGGEGDSPQQPDTRDGNVPTLKKAEETPPLSKKAEEALPLSKLTRIQPTKEGEQILKRLATKGDKMIKLPSESGEVNRNKKSLKWLGDAVKDIPGTSLQRIDEEGYRDAVVIEKGDGKKEIWYVEISGGDTFAKYGEEEFTLVNKNDPQMIAFFNRNSGDAGENAGHILDVLNQARRNADSQRNDPAEVKKFDLTKKRPIGYLCFNGFAKNERPRYQEYSKALPELLQRCGYDMVCLDDTKRITELEAIPSPTAVAGLIGNPTLGGIAGFMATPKESNAKLVERQVEALYQQGVRDFYLNFLTHGDKKEGMGGADGVYLKGEMKNLLLKYPDSRFTVDATGCEGGGWIGMMREFEDVPEAPEGRVSVFVHTREDLSIRSEEYQRLLIKGLTDMADGAPGAPKTYGEAHLRADDETKRATKGRYDPQYWKSRPDQKSVRTAQHKLNPPGEGDRQYQDLVGLVQDNEQKGRC